MNGPAGRASYAYAVARSFDPARLAGVRGVDGAEVHLVPYREIVAVVSPVPLAEFDEAALRAKLERLPWLEATARTHHAVVDAVAACGVTLPLRLATVYRGDERVAEVLRQDYLRRRRAQHRARDDAWQRAAAAAARVDATLAELAVDSRHRPPQSPRLSGARGENVLNATYLVDAERAEEFAARARHLDAEAPDARVELTGPWAPYSFAPPDDQEPA